MWRDFLAFYRARIRPPFFDFEQEAAQRGVGRNREPLGDPALLLPRSRSNVWPRSWKRFMIDFMFGRVRPCRQPVCTCACIPRRYMFRYTCTCRQPVCARLTCASSWRVRAAPPAPRDAEEGLRWRRGELRWDAMVWRDEEDSTMPDSAPAETRQPHGDDAFRDAPRWLD